MKLEFTEDIIFLPGDKTALIIGLHGSMEKSSVIILENYLVDRLTSRGHPFLVLDFSQMKRLESSAMGDLVKVTDRIKEMGGFMCCIQVENKILCLFEMVGLDDQLDIYPDRESVLQFLSGR